MSKTTTTVAASIAPGELAQTPFSSHGRKVGISDKWCGLG
jgi:hypothetical protein